MSKSFPKIRPIDPVPLTHAGRPSLLLRDPLQLNGQALVIPQPLGPLLYLLDGTRDIETIRRILQFHFNVEVDPQTLVQYLDVFDQSLLLDNERTAAAITKIMADYHAAPFRAPASAGYSYADDPVQLHHFLQDHLENADLDPDPGPGKGLLSPHIDYARGAEIYAQVWKRAAAMVAEADLFIVIGTDHFGGQNPLTLTRQNYATPFGALPTDTEIVGALADLVGEEMAFRGEIHHRTEHSLELPLVWLHHLTRDRPVEVVPILCGELDPADGMVQTVAAAVEDLTQGRRVFTVISGDLAHVGPAFGGTPLSPQDRRRIETADEHIFDHLTAGESGHFLRSIHRIGNANNVCGTFPLYLGMEVMGRVQGEAVGYAQCEADDAGTSIVSIGGVVFK